MNDAFPTKKYNIKSRVSHLAYFIVLQLLHSGENIHNIVIESYLFQFIYSFWVKFSCGGSFPKK